MNFPESEKDQPPISQHFVLTLLGALLSMFSPFVSLVIANVLLSFFSLLGDIGLGAIMFIPIIIALTVLLPFLVGYCVRKVAAQFAIEVAEFPKLELIFLLSACTLGPLMIMILGGLG